MISLYGAEPCALTGRTVGGRYEILGALARGGMAEVYLARQTGLDGFEKLVAVKCIARRRADDEYFVAMFLDEARTAGDLRHPHVVQTYEVGVDGDLYFIAMEFLHGASVARLAAHGALPFDVAVHIAREAALGLHHAHTKTDLQGQALGIVHRDVSPQNLMVTVDGVTKVLDFGIALAQTRSVETSTGALKGKYPYMSPEQVNGQPLDGRSDLFALGAILWEMCAGRSLFARGNEALTLDAVRACRVPALSSVVAHAPRALDDVLEGLLRANREDRPKDGAELAARLERVESLLGWVPRASRLAALVAQAMPGPGPALANAATVSSAPAGPSAQPTRSDRVLVAADTLTFLAPQRRALRLAAGAGVLACALVVAAVIATRTPGPSDVPVRVPVPVPEGAPAASAIAGETPVDAPAPIVVGARIDGDDGASARPGTPGAGRSRLPGAPHKGAKGHAPPVDPPPPTTAAETFGALAFPDQDPYYGVRVDGQDIGNTPIRRHAVTTGRHRVQLVAPDSGQVVYDETLDVAEDVTRTVRR